MKKAMLVFSLLIGLIVVAYAGTTPNQNQNVDTQTILFKTAALASQQSNFDNSALAEMEARMDQLKAQGQYDAALWNSYFELVGSDQSRPLGGHLDQGGEDCASATVIPSLPYTDNGTTLGYNNDYDEACPWAGSTSPDVAYHYTPAVDQLVTISLCLSGYDTKLYVYAMPDLVDPIACNDDANPCPGSTGSYRSRLENVALSAGITYCIVVDGYDGDAGNYTLEITAPCSPPLNDQCSNLTNCLIVTPEVPLTLTGNDCGALANDCVNFPAIVWECFTVEGCVSEVNIAYCGSEGTPNAYANVFGDCECGTVYGYSTYYMCDDGNYAVNYQLPNGTYYIPINPDLGPNYTVTVTAIPCPVPGRCCYNNNFSCATTSAAICASLSGNFTEGETCETPCPPPPPECACGPMDLVFAIDTTGSMSGAIASVVAELPSIIATANYFSCDVRLGLVTFGDQVVVNHQLGASHAAVQTSIAALTADGGLGIPECSDEAILEVVNGTSSCVVNDWTSIFRPGAVKIIVLVTDAPPAGCDDNYVPGVDDVQAHNVALAAQGASIRIASVFVPTNGVDPTIIAIMQDYAATTSGSYWLTAANGQGTGGAINALVADCGQGNLQISAPVPPLECINGQIVPNPADFEITVTNTGNEACTGVTLTIGTGSGEGGTGTITPDNAIIGTLAAGESVVVPVSAALTPNPLGGVICFRADVTSDGCPPAFYDICFNVPECEDNCDLPNTVYVNVEEGIPHCECIEACAGVPLTVYFTPLSREEIPNEIRIDDGCTGDPFREVETIPGYGCDNMECPPAYPTWDGNSFYDETIGGWGIVIIATYDGCFCICLDDVLPVELIGFDAVAGDEMVSLSWTTASEINNDRFEILRDAVTMIAIGANNYAAGSHYTWTDIDLVNGREYSYSLVAVSMDGIRETIGTVNATPTMSAATISEYALHQNYPNPFNPETNIIFDIVEAGNVSLTVYNPLGQSIATLVNGTVQAGRHTVTFNGANLPSGLYFYRLDVADFSAIKKMILMK